MGFGRGDAMPVTQLAPPPTFPPLEVRPVQLAAGARTDHLLDMERRLQEGWRAHHLGGKGDPLPRLELDWDRFASSNKF
jgi:hypothetical protein